MEAGDVSRYSSLDATNDPGFFVELMDSFRTVPTFAELKRMMLDQVAPAAGQRVLDVGCGPGDDTRQIAARLVPGGLAVGLDRSAVMVAEARRRAGGSGLPLEFHTGDACALEFPDATFDACRAERVLVHVNDPGRAVAEMTRVTRPGGRVVAFDGDSVTVTIDSMDPGLLRTMEDCFTRRLPNGLIGGRLEGLFEQAGLLEIEAQPIALAMPYSCYFPMVKGVLAAAAGAGELDTSDVARFCELLTKAEADGRFRAGGDGWLVSGTRA